MMSNVPSVGEVNHPTPAPGPEPGTAEYLIAAIKAFSQVEQVTVETATEGHRKISKSVKTDIKRAQADVRRWERQTLQSLTECQNEVTEAMENIALDLEDEI